MTKDRLVERLEEAGLGRERFVQCHSGEKGTHNHTTLSPSDVSGVYGVYVTREDPLVWIDIDDYEDLEERVDQYASIDNHIQVIEASTQLAAHKLASDVQFDDIETAVVVIAAPDYDLELPDLHDAESVIENEYGFSSGESVVAVELRGLQPHQLPGDARFGCWVLAGHSAPLDSQEALFEPNVLEFMPSGVSE